MNASQKKEALFIAMKGHNLKAPGNAPDGFYVMPLIVPRLCLGTFSEVALPPTN